MTGPNLRAHLARPLRGRGTPAIVAGVVDLDLLQFGGFVISHTAAITGMNFTNVVVGIPDGFMFDLVGDGISRAVVYPWTWIGVEPTLISTDGIINRFGVMTMDGETFQAFLIGQGF